MRARGLACLLLALGCGDIATVAGDSGISDSGPPDARAVGSVTVTVGQVFGPSQPLADNQVVFVDPAGAIAADLMTDGDGVATADDIEAGSTLIVLIAEAPTGAPSGTQALVVVGVEPGDDIHFDREGGEGIAAGDMNITWPQRAGTNQYYIDNGCNSTNTNDLITTLNFTEDCLAAGEAQALVRSADASDTTLGWLGGTVAFSSGGTLDIAGPWSAPEILAVSLSDIPAEAQSLTASLIPARGPISFNRANLPPVELMSDTQAVDLPMPTVFADSDLVTLGFTPNQGSFGFNSLSVRVAAGETALDLALADELLPWYGFPVLDSPSRSFSWTRSAGREPDAQFVAIFYTEKGGSERLTLIMLPPDITQVTLPELPSDYEAFMPVNPEQVAIQVQGGEASDLDGYRAARQTGFALVYNSPVLGLEPPATLRRSSGGADF